MDVYQRKLYAWVQAGPWTDAEKRAIISESLTCLNSNLLALEDWWEKQGGRLCLEIAASSDRVNLHPRESTPSDTVTVKHPISGQSQQIRAYSAPKPEDLDGFDAIKDQDARTVFWWLWRFYPELAGEQCPEALLYPAHRVLPDCPLHSYQSTVSAVAGAMYGQEGDQLKPETPYLLLFSFSPVQEFIKASRKFLDFWAGSYLLHYLSAKLCWQIALDYGPDAIIVPSLWSQEIIDAFLIQEYPDFDSAFRQINLDGQLPVERYQNGETAAHILVTAGFPNMITVLVPGQQAAKTLGADLTKRLTDIWKQIGNQVKDNIRKRALIYLTDLREPTEQQQWFEQASFEQRVARANRDNLLQEVFPHLNEQELEPYRRELVKLMRPDCWEWGHLWEAQLSHSWEPYWTAVPLAHPGNGVLSLNKDKQQFPETGWPEGDDTWIVKQQQIAHAPDGFTLPTDEEKRLYEKLNIGSWWGNLQQRLQLALMAVKNTRVWQIPAAPGDRSSLSGQFSAVHPFIK